MMKVDEKSNSFLFSYSIRRVDAVGASSESDGGRQQQPLHVYLWLAVPR